MDFLSTPMPKTTGTEENFEKRRVGANFGLDTSRKKYLGKSAKYWARHYGVSYNRILRHLEVAGDLRGLEDTSIYVPSGKNVSKLTYKGKPYSYWAKEFDVTWVCISTNIEVYGNLDNIGLKTYKRKFHCPLGVFSTIREMSKTTGLTYTVCYNRINNRKYKEWFEEVQE